MRQIFFAWVDGSESTFDPVAHAREDDDIFQFTITHEEGQIPVLELSIQYPAIDGVAIGLLRTSRKQWCWLSWRNPQGIIEPLFFGRLVCIPDNINDIIIPLRFIAKAKDAVAQKQALADTLRVRPFYDPIFLDDKSLEDPEQILTGLSASYHVDRTTLEWTVSDIIIGDETVTFDQSDVIDGSVQIQIKGPPLSAVRVDATVHWKQRYRNTVIPVAITNKMRSYNPNGFASSWPAVGADLGGGWIVAPGTFTKVWGGTPGRVDTSSGSWNDEGKHHNDGDAISMSWNASIPLGGETISNEETVTYGSVGGGIDFLNAPPGEISTGEQSSSPSSSYSRTWKVIYTGYVQCALFVRPDDKPNNYTESITLTLHADTQNLLTDPDTQEETEVIELQGQDIGEAFIDFKCLTSLSGQSVQRGQILYPNLIPTASKQTYQIALNDGVCGVVTSQDDAPLFSDTIGQVAAWGGVDFACVGPTLPSIIDWEPQTFVKVGAILCADAYGGWFFICDQEGFTGLDTPFINVLGSIVPNIATRGAVFNDGGVRWIALGGSGPSLHVPAQGQPGNIISNSFFDKDRGAAAIEYMIMVARNRIRTRARAIEISFRVPFHSAVDLSCRKSASVHVPKLIPGGWATGKIVSYSLSWSGFTGELSAEVKISCAIGSGTGNAAAIEGAPTVADLDALEAPAQVMDGTQNMVGVDVSYQPPPPTLTYNGLRYPLTRDQVVLHSGWVGSKQAQLEAIMRLLARPGGAAFFGLKGAIQKAQRANVEAQQEFKDPYYYEFWLRPISDQHTDTPYEVIVSKLTIPKQIDLEA